MMEVQIQNDGPVTLHLETPNLPPPKEVCYHGSGYLGVCTSGPLPSIGGEWDYEKHWVTI